MMLDISLQIALAICFLFIGITMGYWGTKDFFRSFHIHEMTVFSYSLELTNTYTKEIVYVGFNDLSKFGEIVTHTADMKHWDLKYCTTKITFNGE